VGFKMKRTKRNQLNKNRGTMKNECIFNLLGIYCISVDSNDGDSRFLYVKIRK
jgi:hypothetical protein